MRNLTVANKLMEKLAKDNPRFSPLTVEDYPLFERYFQKEPHTYGNSWTYITQDMYGIGENKLGYKYFDGENLSAVCIYPKTENPDLNVFYWIRPMGKSVLDRIDALSKKIFKELNIPTYAKKLFKDQYKYLKNKGFKDTTGFPWHSLYPEEDDTHPEIILDIENTITTAQKLGKTRQLNRSLKYYETLKNDPSISVESLYKHSTDAMKVLDEFFHEGRNKKYSNISEPCDYYSMILVKPRNIRMLEKMFFINGNSAGFYFSEYQNEHYSSQYAFITLRYLSNHLSDYLMFDMFDELLKHKTKFMNLGGSESQSLDEYKRKFRPVEEKKMFWVTLY